MPYRKTPKRMQHAEDVQNEILDAAVAVIRAHGPEGLTVRRVVEQAGSSVGNYYHHFRDKEALLMALVDRLADRAAREIDTAAEGVEDITVRLRVMVTTGIKAALRDPALAQVLFASYYGEGVRQRIHSQFVERTARFFVAAPVGAAQTVDPAVIAVLWQSTILALVEQLASGKIEISVERAAEVCADWNLRALGLERLESSERQT